MSGRCHSNHGLTDKTGEISVQIDVTRCRNQKSRQNALTKGENNRTVHKIAFIGNYIPRRCGIATFTADILSAVSTQYPQASCFAVAVNDIAGGYKYPDRVRFEIDEKDLSSYRRAAEFLNINDLDVVCLQHEFGIFGGPAGSHVLALLRDLKFPIITTLHTVLQEPSPEQYRVMRELIELSSRLIVMSRQGENFLRKVYKAPADMMDVIPHGIPDMQFIDPNFYKDSFGVEGKTVLLTFGLLSPNKGIEYVFNALPGIVSAFPNVVYVVLGVTHPDLVRQQGETYRLSLERLAVRNGVEKNVVFYNQYVELERLIEFIGAADVYITPYLNEAQIVSGTLAYSFGAGKAVVSTPYWHAAELLADGRGVLVPFGEQEPIAREVISLLQDDARRHRMRKNAYKLGREMVWSNVARKYMESFEKARVARGVMSRKLVPTGTLEQRGVNLPGFRFDHLSRMVDSTGVLQHATYTVPNFAEGYSTDDNARGLILAVLLEQLGIEDREMKLISSETAGFLTYSLDRTGGRFRNFMSYDRKWLEAEGSEDSHGRAIWALGTCVGRSHDTGLQRLAGQLLEIALPSVIKFRSPRAWAFSLIGIHEYLRRLSGDRFVNSIRDELTDRLMGQFEENASEDWLWFEDIVAYDNAKLPHALMLSGRWTDRPEVYETGLRSLHWLLEIQTSEDGYFRPIGSDGFYRRNGERAVFDQQPLEAHAMVSACLEAYLSTSDNFWLNNARMAFDWFLGRNDLGVALYDSTSGGCRDALHVDRVNENQGAESTLAFLLSLAEMKLVRNTVAAFNEPLEPGTKIQAGALHES